MSALPIAVGSEVSLGKLLESPVNTKGVASSSTHGGVEMEVVASLTRLRSVGYEGTLLSDPKVKLRGVVGIAMLDAS
jgi:hypothetical protein